MSQIQRSIRFSNTNMKFDFITEDTTIYLSPSGSGGSDDYDENSEATPWLTIDKALDYLKDKRIQTDKYITIQLADGEYTHTSQIDVDHPDGERITIKGENYYTISLTSIQSVGGKVDDGDFDYRDIILNVSSTNNIEIDDYVLIGQASGGTRPKSLEGVWKITNVDIGNSRITIRWKCKDGQYDYYPTGAVSTSNITVIKSILSFTGCSGLICENNNVINLKYLVFVGDSTTSDTNGISTRTDEITNFKSSGSINGQYIGTCNWESYGIISRDGGKIHMPYCFSSNNYDGIIAMNGGYLYTYYSAASGNLLTGFYASNNSMIYCEYCDSIVNYNGFLSRNGSTMSAENSSSGYNSNDGFWATRNSHLLANNSTSEYNGSDGYIATYSSFMELSDSRSFYNAIHGYSSSNNSSIFANNPDADNNGAYGYHANVCGTMRLLSPTGTGNGSGISSPTYDTDGNSSSYIDT